MLQVLAIAGLVAAIGSNIGVALLALGRYRTNMWLHGLGLLFLIPMLAVGARYGGGLGAALAVLAANSLTVLVAVWVGGRAFEYGLRKLIARVWRPFVAAAVMYLIVQPLANDSSSLISPLDAPARLASIVLAGAAIYPSVLALCWLLSGRPDGAERLAIGVLGRLSNSLRARFLRGGP
jgi:O-antigen/teichoic acid export membrane protein